MKEQTTLPKPSEGDRSSEQVRPQYEPLTTAQNLRLTIRILVILAIFIGGLAAIEKLLE